VAQLYPQALGSLFVASYDSQGYSGGIRIPLHMASFYGLSTDHIENTFNSSSVVAYVSAGWGLCLPSCCLSIDNSSGSAILALRCHVAILGTG
jgi:hypothetical protein